MMVENNARAIATRVLIYRGTIRPERVRDATSIAMAAQV
ncbi:hypothetical protein MES5069_1540001 [Mesorhizobium escarrei]|uniref:Uncharacterized protein n=1 Tax=Mesorhizobium escarrei TaxID=666018 RepID=A0ABM9DJU6_9HYPH|nr:hypothetical protein MES5069_1540001 [Mesorhizobium escarrei]